MPAAQNLVELAEFTVDAVTAEDPPAQHQPLEAAEPVKPAPFPTVVAQEPMGNGYPRQAEANDR